MQHSVVDNIGLEVAVAFSFVAFYCIAFVHHDEWFLKEFLLSAVYVHEFLRRGVEIP